MSNSHHIALPIIVNLLPFLFLLGIVFFIFAVALGLTAFWIWMIVDCVKNEPVTGNEKIIWLLLLLFTHLIGALIYFFVRRVPRQRLMASVPAIPKA